jgi:hypothetical protein
MSTRSSVVEALVDNEFSFTSPYDDHIDRATYFERCWPNAGRIKGFRIRKLHAEGDDVFVLYELRPRKGEPFHNAEYLRFRNGRLAAVEVYFGEINGVERTP